MEAFACRTAQTDLVFLPCSRHHLTPLQIRGPGTLRGVIFQTNGVAGINSPRLIFAALLFGITLIIAPVLRPGPLISGFYLATVLYIVSSESNHTLRQTQVPWGHVYVKTSTLTVTR